MSLIFRPQTDKMTCMNIVLALCPVEARFSVLTYHIYIRHLIVAGGSGERGVECFSLPSAVNKMGQWTSIYPLPKPLDLLVLHSIDFGFIGFCKYLFAYV